MSAEEKPMEKPYPKSLNNPPLLEMIVEFRFVTSLPEEALFGLYYPVIKEQFSSYTPLPIMNIPLEVRRTDPALRHQPQYHFFNPKDSISLLIGSKTLTFKYERFIDGDEYAYKGWKNHIAKFISKLAKRIFQVIEINEIERIGMRYIDFLDNIKLQEYITPSFNFPNRGLERIQITCSIKEDEILHTINLSDSAEFKHFVNNNLEIHKQGSLIDIDSEYQPKDKDNFLENIDNILTQMHDGNKNLFYEIMKNDLVEMYKPIYEGDDQ